MSLIPIPEHEHVYQQRMASISDVKAALLSHAPKGACVLDYGCGAGDVVSAAERMRPDLNFAGFDVQADAIVAARKKGLERSEFFTNEGQAFSRVLSQDGPKVLFLSSVIHEVVSVYGDDGLRRLIESAAEFDVVIIRDMAYEEALRTVPDAVPDVLADTNYFHEFSETWGVPDTVPLVAHLMLKARYPDNWPAELLENYFCHSAESLIREFSVRFPIVRLMKHETPSFLSDDMKRRFGRGPKTKTHLEAVLSRT